MNPSQLNMSQTGVTRQAEPDRVFKLNSRLCLLANLKLPID